MNFFSKLTTAGRVLVIAVIVAIFGGIFYAVGGTKGGISLGGSKDADATLVVNTYCGFSPIVWANGGLEGSDTSFFAKNYGLKLKIVIMDDFDAARSALKNGDVDIEYCTLDALPVEMSSAGTMTDAKYFMLLNFSAGADALVANSSIKKVADLKGKRVAYTEGTASHTLLINALETSNLEMKNIVPVKVSSGIEAAQLFKSKNVDCAAVWAPDDKDCVDAVAGAHILTSTAQSNMLVSDGLIAKKDWLEKNSDLAKKIVEAILAANSEVSNSKAAFNQAAESFAKAFESDVEFAKASSSTINYATLADEQNWLGLNGDYTGMTGERIYSKMSRQYSQLGLCKSVMPWSKIANIEIVEAVASQNELKNNQTAKGTATKAFEAPKAADETKEAFTSKKVTINFPTAGFTLDDDAKSIIDREFVDIIQSYANTRVRIEGNTDATGNYDSNVELSKKRAASVANYIEKQYGISKNRIIVVGNGPKHAIAAGVQGDNANYRTTDLSLLAE